MTSFTSDYDRSRDGSPDRVDALVFALTELMCNQPVGGFFAEALLLAKGAPVNLPTRISYVFAVAAVPSKAADSIGVIYLAFDEFMNHFPLTILDWDLRPVDDALIGAWLPSVYRRLDELTRDTLAISGNAGLWMHATSGVCAALFAQAVTHGHPVTDIDRAAPTWATAPLADRIATASRHLHTGRRVKIARAAYEKLVEYKGFTRNHLVAQLTAYRVDEELPSDELLTALISAVLVSLDDSPVIDRDISATQAEQVPESAPAPPVPPSPTILLAPGRHEIDGAIVNVPANGDDTSALVWFPIAAGPHVVDQKIVHAHAPGGGIRVA